MCQYIQIKSGITKKLTIPELNENNKVSASSARQITITHIPRPIKVIYMLDDATMDGYKSSIGTSTNQ